MDEVASSLAKLKIQIQLENNSNSDDALRELDVISQRLKDVEKKVVTEHLLTDGIGDVLASLLKNPDKLPAALAAKVSEVVAELGKTETARQNLTNSALVEPLVKLLDRDESEVVLQTCRALGNICYDNDAARGLVKEENGVGKLVGLLQKLLVMGQMPDNLRTVASGCLLNLTDTYKETQDQALKAGIVEVLLQYLQRFSTDEDVATHCLLVLNCLADLENGRKRLVERPVLSLLMKVAEHNLTNDVMESMLELFANLAENDVVKKNLSELGLCQRLISLVGNCQQKIADEEGAALVKPVCDLVVLLLTGDESMELLYDSGKGPVYKETVAWLLSTNENLQVAGALAAGNFARKDAHCIRMVEDGVAKDLLDLIEKHSSPDGDIRLQHALLSALRNLSIPAENKAILYDLGILDKLLPMISIETFPVVFKLLGAFRMIVDKQENAAKTLGQNVNLLKRLVFWCGTDDHPGIKGEASRILAWLIKNSKCSEVMTKVAQEGGIPHLIAMVTSEHPVMQNEALLALTLVSASVLAADRVKKDLQESKISSVIHLLLQKENLKPEILSNCLSLVAALSASNDLRVELRNAGVGNDLKSFDGNSSVEVLQKIQQVMQSFTTD